MNRIRILGLITLIIGILGMNYFQRTEVEFLFGIITGIGIGWLLTGKLMIMREKKQSSRT